MAPEIEILKAAFRNGFQVVEKDTNLRWTEEDLANQEQLDRLEDTDSLAASDPNAAVTSLFPGCLQQMSRTVDLDSYAPLGQTEHFVIFFRRGLTTNR
jgi:hypothetical protein